MTLTNKDQLRAAISEALTIYKPAPFKDAPPIPQRRANEKQIDALVALYTQQLQAVREAVEAEMPMQYPFGTARSNGDNYNNGFNACLDQCKAALDKGFKL